MKVWELEEGKEYVELGDWGDGRYTIRNSKLMYFADDKATWIESGRHFDELMEMNLEEYSPPTDWSKVEVDTKVLVSGFGEECRHRHFAKYEHGKVYAWCEGRTSFTSNGEGDISSWSYAKLYTEE